jgi:hypothetical protein
MATHTVHTKFFRFRQNNSGGFFKKDDAAGIGVSVYIEALNADDANHRAERAGIYFEGCATGEDCRCCGDRWMKAYDDEGEEKPGTEMPWDFEDTVFIHHFDGRIERCEKSDAA